MAILPLVMHRLSGMREAKKKMKMGIIIIIEYIFLVRLTKIAHCAKHPQIAMRRNPYRILVYKVNIFH